MSLDLDALDCANCRTLAAMWTKARAERDRLRQELHDLSTRYLALLKRPERSP